MDVKFHVKNQLKSQFVSTLQVYRLRIFTLFYTWCFRPSIHNDQRL